MPRLFVILFVAPVLFGLFAGGVFFVLEMGR